MEKHRTLYSYILEWYLSGSEEPLWEWLGISKEFYLKCLESPELADHAGEIIEMKRGK